MLSLPESRSAQGDKNVYCSQAAALLPKSAHLDGLFRAPDSFTLLGTMSQSHPVPLTEVFRSPFLKAPLAAGHCHAHLMVMRNHNQVNEESAGSQQVQIVTTMPLLHMHAISLELLVNAIHILPRTVIALKLLHLNPIPSSLPQSCKFLASSCKKLGRVPFSPSPPGFIPLLKEKAEC